MPNPSIFRSRDRRPRSAGQSLVELSLILPVLLLLVLIAVDFGRVYLGWINVQQMTRVAANFAADHATAWSIPDTPAKAADRAEYQRMVKNAARVNNCRPPNPLPAPVFGTGSGLGHEATVGLNCQFDLITPLISQVVGGTILVSGATTMPVKEGAVATVPGGGGPIVTPPQAKFVASPRSGWAPFIGTFVDQSTNAPTSWTWQFAVAASGAGTGTGSVTPDNSLSQGPNNVSFDCAGVPGDTCTFDVSLAVGNAGGVSSTESTDYVTVVVPPPTGPIAEFTATPRSGTQPVNTTFQFVDLRAGAVTYTSYQWDFTNDGSFDATGLSVTHSYPTPGSYDVRLRVTDSTGAQSTLVKYGYIIVSKRLCTVPDFGNTKKNQAQSRWATAGFSTTVGFLPGSNNYTIRTQTIVGGTIDPQPNGCASDITVGP